MRTWKKYGKKDGKQRLHHKRKRQEYITLAVFLIIPLLFLLYFSVYPVFSMFYYSLQIGEALSAASNLLDGKIILMFLQMKITAMYLKQQDIILLQAYFSRLFHWHLPSC